MLAQVQVSKNNALAFPRTLKELRQALAAMAQDLFYRALRLSRSQATAQDLVQDTVERALRFQRSFRPGTNLRAWVHQILFSVFITRCRRDRRERRALGELYMDPNSWTAPCRSAEMMALSPPTARAFASLPKQFRDAVTLVDLQELPYKEAARRLRVPTGTVMSRVHRGRKMLAEALIDAESGTRLAMLA